MSKETGEKIRREVMGDEFVDRALNNVDELTAPLQDYINEHAWGSTWQREDLDRKTRSLVTLAMLTAQKAVTEIKGHTRGALRNGASKQEIAAVFLHSAVYCGAPTAQEAFRAAKEVLDNWEE
ncbi:4-carboxymuconolactone decarboxylase [Bermanella marisrubri]|uniref:4-carboxymuconolactone decarboxylase n=1 Tax=Bermanella marisrubri TaxID=207949 RepID=Q1N280_9GAMM|nr:carboxymuconolactone decarboxylase family protein [Bermanella marisrubri]EAT12284.1 4-carboxymuconolactone decarboxylase [Bermanella marisrubri]QIZ85374.1 4-carboxymuconolactone decarboxylase [Bermanella marisrubri]